MNESDAAQSESRQQEDPESEDFQQKIREMQKRIETLESELIRFRSSRLKINLPDLFLLIIVTLLAAVPPLLVVAQRWLELIPPDFLQDTWCKSSYFCHSMLPPYFLIVFACFLGLLLILFFLRRKPIVVNENELVPLENSPVNKRQSELGLVYILVAGCGFVYIGIRSLIIQQFPGWSLVYVWLAFMLGCILRTVTIESLKGFWLKQGEFLISVLLVHVSIVGLLVGSYGQPSLFWATVVMFVLAMGNIWRFRRAVPPIFWIMSLAMVVYTININGWWTSTVGDEYNFHELAWNLAEKTSFTELGKVLFRGDGAHGAHPYFSSFLQAVTMKFFGHENFGWRFSNPYMCSLAVGLFYLFCKSFLSKRISLIAAFLLAVSSYIMSFSKIGYNNLQSLFALTLVLAVSAWALRSKSILAFACLGSTLAFCFYTYPASFYVLPLPFLLFALYYPPKNRAVIKNWGITVLVAVTLIFPLLMQPVYWESKLAGTFLNQPVLLQSFGNLLLNIGNNLLYAFFSFLYISSESHFVASSYLDPITTGFFLVGFCLLLYQMRRQRFPIFILICYVYFLFAIGASHDRQAPPNTRMFMFLPLYALIAAWGIDWISVKAIQAFSFPVKTRHTMKIALLTAITLANLYQAYPLSHMRFPNMQTIESLFVRITKNVNDAEPNIPKNYAIIVDETWGVNGLLMLQKIYSHMAWIQIKQVTLTGPELPDSSLELLKDRNTIVIIMPWLDPEWMNAIDAPLLALDKERCEITTYTGDRRFPALSCA